MIALKPLTIISSLSTLKMIVERRVILKNQQEKYNHREENQILELFSP
jgi:hypothetical protein